MIDYNKTNNNHEIENYSWGVLQDMIEKEVNAAFKIRPQPPCKRWKRKKLGKNEYWTPDSFEKNESTSCARPQITEKKG